MSARAHLLLAAATLAAGLLSRAARTGWYALDKSLGDALYAALVYWALALCLRRWRPPRLLLLAGACCFAIEAFKLTGLPAAWSGLLLSRLVFGTTPSLHNLACYVAGAVAAAWLDARLRRPAPARGRPSPLS